MPARGIGLIPSAPHPKLCLPAQTEFASLKAEPTLSISDSATEIPEAAKENSKRRMLGELHSQKRGESSLSPLQHLLALSGLYRVGLTTGLLLLPQGQRNHLGIQGCDDLIREKRSIDASLAFLGAPKNGEKMNGHQNKSYNTMEQPLGTQTNSYQVPENPVIISMHH